MEKVALTTAIETPVPMDDSAGEEEEGGEEAPKETGYGPVRKKDQEKAAVGGVVFQPAEVEDVAIEAAEDDGAGESEGENNAPYAKPSFRPLTAKEQGIKKQLRRVPVPPNRMTPLKNSWMELIKPVVEHLKLQVRMNTKRRAVEVRSSENSDIGSLQKAADYFRAFMLGFSQDDAIALLRLDDLFIESFEVKDVKRLEGDHLARCIGRIAGKDGKTKYAIENSTRTRISLCEDKIHILGSFANIRLARHSICNLILGCGPEKVYTKLRTVSKRLQERI